MQQPDPLYASHSPILEHYLQETEGNVLEFGVGWGSTPLIRKFMKGSRKMLFVDNDGGWMSKIKEVLPEDENHIYGFVTDWTLALKSLSEFDEHWSIIFIDQSPWEARTLSIELLKDKADYIIVHDVDYFPEHGIFGKKTENGRYNFDDILLRWKFYETLPPTLVGTQSNKRVLFDVDNVRHYSST